MTDRPDVFSMTHEELDLLVADLRRQADDARGLTIALRAKLANLTPALERGGFVTLELDLEPTVDERRALASAIAPLVQELGLRVLVIGPNMKARASHRCESCGKAKK